MKNRAQQPQPQQEATFTTKEMSLLLNCTTDKLHQLQYKYGLAYLRHYLPGDEQAWDTLERSKIFWGWFKLQWLVYDQVLIEDVDFINDCISERRSFYSAFHNPKQMAEAVKPNSVVLAELSFKTKKLQTV